MKIKPGTPLNVRLHFSSKRQRKVGRLALGRDGVAAFEYDPEFLATGQTLNPLQPLPDTSVIWAQEPRTFDGLHGIFADSLPDAWGEVLMRRRAEKNDIDYHTLTGLDKLAIIGSRGMGALVYEPEIAAEPIDAIDLDLVAENALTVLEGHESTILPQLERLGGPSGGARPKVLIGLNPDGAVIAGDVDLPVGFDAWLVKFRSSRHDYSDMGPLEAAYADMSRDAGLSVSPTKLIESKTGSPGYFATKRFDRMPGNERIHVASVAGLLDADWDSPAIDYDQLLKVTRYVTRDQRAVEAIFHRMVFNVVAHNRDDHMKQHAFLMDEQGQWSAAPSYDLVYSRGPSDNHYLAVKGETGDRITLDVLRQVGLKHGIDTHRIDAIIDQVVETVSRFRDYAGRYGLSAATEREIARALDADLRRLTTGSVASPKPKVRHPEHDEPTIGPS